MNCYVFITLEWAIYNYIYRGSPHMEVAIMFLQEPLKDKLLYRTRIITVVLAKKHWHNDEQVTVIFAMTSVIE